MVGFLQQQIDSHYNDGNIQTGSGVDAARYVAEICVTATKFKLAAFLIVKLHETSVWSIDVLTTADNNWNTCKKTWNP